MTHQQLSKFDPETEGDVPITDEELGNIPPKRAWEFMHWGGSGENWRQPGDITIWDPGTASAGSLGDSYLEARIKEVPFFSIVASEDQWGTWYSLKLEASDTVLRRNSEDGTITFAQEWGGPSFLRALGAAITAFAEMNEPSQYDATTLVEVAPSVEGDDELH